MKPLTFNSDKLRTLRKERRWSQQDLSVEISVYARKHKLDLAAHPDTIDNWEEGRNFPPSDMLPILAAVFAIEINQFYTNGS